MITVSAIDVLRLIVPLLKVHNNHTFRVHLKVRPGGTIAYDSRAVTTDVVIYRFSDP